ncbi:MAG: choice-of-anchor M domain-containing protein, partial [Buchananella hordeovulneris]|nr:choice-of-anchor M domain-containing protein [Buchananella hordeovulneris]
MTISTHENVQASRFGRLGAVGAGVAVALAGILLPTSASAAANALPDDSNLTVAPIGHVDSPKTYFENDEFVLKGHFGRNNNVPLDTALHHLGKSYLGSRNMYVFTVPENAPELDFLGEAGDNWYMGYFGSDVARIAIWAGFGAESNIPVEEFRDATFTLDLVSVDGPGRVELFTWAEGFEEEEAGMLGRMFSSTDPAFRSFFMVPGSHTHNYTLFSAPGRYDVKYRATARKADGTLLTSRESVARWQVGGARPPTAGLSTSSTRTATVPTLTVGPATGANEPDSRVVPKLDRLRVDMGADVAGTATFLINGYKLADVALSNGVAEMVDLLGSAENEIQAQVRGVDGQVVFTSDPVSYEHGGQAATTTATAEALVDKSPAPSLHFPITEVTAAADPVVNITLAPGERGTLQGTFTVSDPTALGKVQVAAYSKSTDKTWQVDMNFFAGGKTGPFVGQISDGAFYQDHYVVARFIPHPFMTNLRTSEVIVTEALNPSETTTVTLTVVRDEEPEPSESASASATPTPEVSVTATPEVSASASTTASA